METTAESPQVAPDVEPPPVCDPVPVVNGVAVVYGYGVKLSVVRSHLFISDGICDERRAGYLNRATSGLKHLVVLSHSGTITIDALRWLYRLGASVSMIDADGAVIFASAPPGADNTHLRRGQVLADGTEVGLEITRALLTAKVDGQGRVLRALGHDDVADHLIAARDTLSGATTLDDVRLLEALAANLYWDSWVDLPINFARRDVAKVPGHWTTFGQRNRNGTPRNATGPGGALLNYLFAILETETRIGLLALGLDPGLGFNHRDTPYRDSLALDVMEPIRPEVEAWLLAFLRERTFAKSDFAEGNDGVCRIGSRLARELCATVPLWRALLGPVVEKVAATILAGHKPGALAPTNLTHARHRAANAARRGLRREPSQDVSQTDVMRTSDVANQLRRTIASPAMCLECGAPVAAGSRYCSDACRKLHGREVLSPKAGRAGQVALAAKRAERAARGETVSKPGAHNQERREEALQWEREHPEVDLDTERLRYACEILPRLQITTLNLGQIVAATGWTKGYASLVRANKRTPHPKHFATLVQLLDAHNAAMPKGNR
jgi:CRISPR-associated endonuclease Cas1